MNEHFILKKYVDNVTQYGVKKIYSPLMMSSHYESKNLLSFDEVC